MQTAAIPPALTGIDLTVEAQTGSGKTAAFVLPILTRDLSNTCVLCLTPTRELALQVAAAFKQLSRFLPVPPSVLAIIGGEPIEQQISALTAGVNIVVATPGRLLDLLTREQLSLGSIHTLVLDEADKLLDLGFKEELSELLSGLSAPHQTLLFSATLPPTVLALSSKIQSTPTYIQVDAVHGHIHQRVFQVNRDRRRLLLQHLITTEAWGQTLVFVATQRSADNLANKLWNAGYYAEALHGGLAQSERSAVLKRFKSHQSSLLIATDLAARGIDIPQLSGVLNYDLPRSPRGYLHRIGRTGRAGHTGIAISFVDHDTEAHFRLIEKRCQVRLPREQVEGFELNGEPPPKKRGGPAIKGKRKSKKDKLREAAARELQTHRRENKRSSAAELDVPPSVEQPHPTGRTGTSASSED